MSSMYDPNKAPNKNPSPNESKPVAINPLTTFYLFPPDNHQNSYSCLFHQKHTDVHHLLCCDTLQFTSYMFSYFLE